MEYERKALFGAYRLNEASKTLQVWRSIAPLSRRIIHRLTSRMLIVAVLSARELTVALQYQLTADTVYRATLVRIDSRRTSETRRFSSLFFSFFHEPRVEKQGVKSRTNRAFYIFEGTPPFPRSIFDHVRMQIPVYRSTRSPTLQAEVAVIVDLQTLIIESLPRFESVWQKRTYIYTYTYNN